MTGEENVCGGKEGTERALEAEGKKRLGSAREISGRKRPCGGLRRFGGGIYPSQSTPQGAGKKSGKSRKRGCGRDGGKADRAGRRSGGGKAFVLFRARGTRFAFGLVRTSQARNGRKRRAPAIRTKTSSMRRPGAAKECD